MPEAPTWGGPPPADITAWTIVQAGHAIGHRFWSALADVGVTPIQFGVLLQLDLQPGQSNAALARTVLVTPQSMSEMLTGMVEAGLIERDAATGPGRPITTRLTAAGRAALKQCQDVVASVETSLGLTPTQLRRLNHLLRTAMNA